MEKAKLTLDRDFTGAEIDKRLYGSFAEHLGRCIYGGLYDPTHPDADDEGFRTDVISAIRDLGATVIRYPGGNFVSAYRWEDGVGPRELRPRRPEIAWSTTETNQFGTDEFMSWCKKAGVEPMMAVNLGSRGAEDAKNLLEYCNAQPGTFYADMRAKNASKDPYGVKLWCLGNEMDGPWQVGHKDAHDYAMTANSASRAMKLLDPDIQTIACGSSNSGMNTFIDWEREVLDLCWDTVDYISLHTYFGNSGGDVPSFLARSLSMDSFIDTVGSLIDTVKAKKRSKKNVYLSFDEWNVWYHSNGAQFERWSVAPPILEDVYDFADTLVVGAMLNSLIRHADRVKIACLAQIVNVIAPIMTETGGRLARQTTYYPIMLTAKNVSGKVLEQRLDCPKYDCKDFTDVPYLDTVCAVDGDRLTVTVVNRSLEEPVPLEAVLRGFGKLGYVSGSTIAGHALDTVNTFDSEPVRPRPADEPEMTGNGFNALIPAASWNLFTFSID
ncbi:MAG: alpha-N-arabinofuranosidase [Clostridia bacterium]|nr:alpha-N-arabinofuranosidase [Clostridia bacterium]